ncbi:MAG: flagellar motor switch protein FliN, partial [Betaproteobacteria bacterium]|nr:flagellar motor switch protein FliN [Betaproteobacteria bacterium]
MTQGGDTAGASGMSDAELDWAQALEEQSRVEAAVAPEQGGPLGQDNAEAHAAIGQIQQDITRVLDIPVQLSVELGRTRVPIKYILQLAQGSVVELDALAGEPMDVLVNGYLIAQGEVVVV